LKIPEKSNNSTENPRKNPQQKAETHQPGWCTESSSAAALKNSTMGLSSASPLGARSMQELVAPAGMTEPNDLYIYIYKIGYIGYTKYIWIILIIYSMVDYKPVYINHINNRYIYIYIVTY